MTDVEILLAAQQGDRDALDAVVRRFRRVATSASIGLFLIGADRDDLEQEALIGILHAVRTYDPAKTDNPSGFVKFCVRRHLLTQVARAQRVKARSLSESLRTIHANGDDGNEDDMDASEALIGEHSDPVEVLIRRERVATVVVAWRTLSPLERRCLTAVAAGKSYRELCAAEGVDFKGADNALYRARNKLRAAA